MLRIFLHGYQPTFNYTFAATPNALNMFMTHRLKLPKYI